MQRRKHRTFVRCFHIFTATFQFKKLEKQDFSDNEFFSATGDILEMQQGIFMNWCDSNARASKKNKPTGHRSLLPHREQIGGLFSLLRCLCCFCFVCVPFLDGIGNSFLVIFRVCLRYKKAKEASENGNYQKLVCSDSHRPPRASQRRTGTVGPDHQRVHRQPHPRLDKYR